MWNYYKSKDCKIPGENSLYTPACGAFDVEI